MADFNADFSPPQPAPGPSVDFSPPQPAPGPSADFSPPQPAPGPSADFSPPQPAPGPSVDFSPPQPAPGTLLPLSDEQIQQKMPRLWSIAAGKSFGSPADWAAMQESGHFTPEQIKSAQTETALRQQYTDERAQGANQGTAGRVWNGGVSALGNIAHGVAGIPSLIAGVANYTDPTGVASAIEGSSQAATGLLGMVGDLGKGIKSAYGQVTHAPQNPEQDYQNWKLNYLQSHAVPGYAPPSTTSRVQDLASYLTGAPAEAFPAPDESQTAAANLLASIPLFEGATGLAGKVVPAALDAAGIGEAASKYAPTLSNIGNTAGAQAAKIRNAANEAIEPGSTPLLAKDVTAPVAKAVTGVGNWALDKAGNTISGIGKAATVIGDRIAALPGVSSTAAQLLATAVVGPKAVLMAEGAIKALQKVGPKATDLGDAMSRFATANPNDPFGRFMAIAADSDAPPWLKTFAKNPAIQFAAKAGTSGAGAVKGAAEGAATAGAVSILSNSSPEETGENIANFGAFGGLHGGLSAKEGKVFDANIGSVSKFITDSLASGTSPETLKLVPLSDIMQASLLKNAQPYLTVRFATPLDPNSPSGPNGVAKGQAGLDDPANNTYWIDPTKRAPGSTVLHEAFHPLYRKMVGEQPGIKAVIDASLARTGSSIDEFKKQYADKVYPNDPQAAADYLNSQDSQSPDWAYTEMLSEAAAHNLDGKDLLSAMQGQDVQQTASQIALHGVSGWLNDMGVDLQKDQATGTIFPKFEKTLNDPALRSLTFRLLKAQRDSVLGKQTEAPAIPVTSADMGGNKAPLYVSGPNNEKINAYGKEITTPAGKTTFKPWSATELRRRAKAEFQARKKYFQPGQSVNRMPAGLEADPDIAPWTKQALRSAFDAIQNKNNLSLWYHRLNGENSATSDKGWAADVKRTLGNVEASYQSGKPLGVELTSKGNLITRWESEEAENQKLADWANRHGDLSLDLWGGDQTKAKADIQTYLENHATSQPGESNGIGTAKRDVINALLAGANKEFEAKNPLRAKIRGKDRAGIMRSLRVDRMESTTPEPSNRAPANWESLKHNLSPSDDPNAVKAAAVRDRKTGRIFPASSHRGARMRSPKSGESLEDGFITNSGKFLTRDQAYERAVAMKQYKPTDEDSNFITKRLYGLTSERFNKQNPNQAYGAQWMPEIAGPKPGKRMGRYSPAAESKTRTPDEDIRKQAADYTKEAGYDGAILEEYDEHDKPHDVYVAFQPEQIKSASGNSGKFNPKNPNITLSPSADDKEKLSYPMEMAPGKASGILPGLQGAPYAAKEEYQQGITKAMKPLFDAFEVKPGETTKSSYKNSAGETEHNPMTTVELPADKARLFALLHGLFTSQEAVAGGYSEVKPGDWQLTHPSSFSESPDYAEKINATPAGKALLAELAPKIRPAIQAVNDSWGKKLAGKTFSPAAEDSTEPLYYSKLKNTVDEKFSGESMPAAQLAAILRNPSNGVKADELKWSGIDDFLRGKHRVSKEEVRDYLDSQDLTPIEATKKADEFSPVWTKRGPDENGRTVWTLDGDNTRIFIHDKINSAGVDPYSNLEYEVYSGYSGHPRNTYSTLEEAKEAAEEHYKPGELGGDTAYMKYSLPGPKENYREILFQLPKIPAAFESPHWDEKNVLAHARVDDRNNVDGKPGLFVEEIQSDWHQEGRKKGYDLKEFGDAYEAYRDAAREAEGQLADKFAAMRAEVELTGDHAAWDTAYSAARKARNEAIEKATRDLDEARAKYNPTGKDLSEAVPDAPLKNTWQETVFRRLMQMAAQTGKDWVGWTTGSQNADRYGLEKHIDGLIWQPSTGALSSRKSPHSSFELLAHVPADKLPDYVGKEVAEKLIAKEEAANGFKYLTGLDLKVGGEGMAGFYDKILVDYANKFGKKFGARTHIEQIPGVSGKEEDEQDIHILPITPEMKESVTKSGIPFYSPSSAPGAGVPQKPAKAAQFSRFSALAAPPTQQKQQP